MKKIVVMFASFSIVFCSAVTCFCGKRNKADDENFKYLVDEFADIQVIRYRIPGWDSLSFKQKEYVYHLSEAAKWGRDIIWDQNCRCNLDVRHAIEAILNTQKAKKGNDQWDKFVVYAKRVFFSNGIHHHYAENKFFPECSKEYFAELLKKANVYSEELLEVIYDPDIFPEHCYIGDGDLVARSSVNFYEGGLTKDEVNLFYQAMADKSDPRPISYGLNSKLVKDVNGNITEQTWKVGGLYSAALEKICEELEKAAAVAETQAQAEYTRCLIEYYKTGDLRMWDLYNIKWVQALDGTVDYVNGFVEDYDDPLGRKASWEGIVDIKDFEASARTEKMSRNAQWFEDNAPMDERFKKKEVKGVSAKVINVTVIAGDNYPATAIGINLPNADWIRREYGSKSVTISNITNAYTFAANERPKSLLSEFAWDQAEIDRAEKYAALTGEVHTDLHECLGHGSGQLLPGVSPNALAEYSAALEESRADIFGLYYIADPKLVELGILPDTEAYKSEYDAFIRNGLMTQFTRVEPGRPNTESHMQDRLLISSWCYEKGKADNVIEMKVRDGKTFIVINDYQALRALFGQLLGELQRIKSEGDYAAGKALVENYAVNIDPVLHREVLERYSTLGLKPYGGFINPSIVPVEMNGQVVDYQVVYNDSFLQQQLEYGSKYKTL